MCRYHSKNTQSSHSIKWEGPVNSFFGSQRSISERIKERRAIKMPNWCQNFLRVQGNKEEVEEFVIFVRSENVDEDERIFDFNKILPYPKIFQEQDERVKDFWRRHGFGYNQKFPEGGWQYCWDNNLIPPKDGFNSGGYEWCCDNWGTKWNSWHVESLIKPGNILYYFMTAWSPPLPVIHEAGVKFPHLEFTIEYIEYGAGFKGTFRIRNGKIIKDIYGEIPDEEYETADNVFF